MKTILNGKKYDTETAEYICDCPLSTGITKNGIYRKKNGEFFRCSYSIWQNSRGECTGAIFEPLSDSEARRALEGPLSVEEYEDIFGKIDE